MTLRPPQATDPLSPLVRDYFQRLPGVGGPPKASPDGAGRLWRGEAGRERDGTRVVFHISAALDGRVTEVRFQAYGCPHTLATAAWLVEQLRGRNLENLLPSTPADWAAALQIPVEKLGRLLIIEDALRSLT